MLVEEITLEEQPGCCVLTASVTRERDGLTRRVEYRFHGCPPSLVSNRGDAFVAGLLLPAMQAGENLKMDAPVSPLLMGRVEEITQMLTTWWPRLRSVQVEAPVAVPERSGTAIGLFFSGGVDSYYTLLKNMEDHPTGDDAITHLLFVLGADSRYGYDQTYMDRITTLMQEVSGETGKRAIILECNLRWLFPDLNWLIYHGSAMISIALALSPLFKRSLLSASQPPDPLIPWGSHPHLDPLWATEGIEIVHAGGEVYRTEKIASHISRSELALRTLRVCFEVEQQPKNCGRCRKCLQTMVALHAAGALERCSTFVRPLKVGRVRRMPIEARRYQMRRLLGMLGESRYDRRLARAIRFAVWLDGLKQVLKRRVPALLVIRRLLRVPRRRPPPAPFRAGSPR